MGDDRDDSSAVWIGVLVWSIFPNYFAIYAGHTSHRRHFEDASGGRLFFELWGRKYSTGTGLSKVVIGMDALQHSIVECTTSTRVRKIFYSHK
mmetsp:Transcript_22825/g.47871  ORF Transcript_22825/g.47871 Transcript_22825/m.47871 type:complete len:93 (-) Transcript_22825:1876-2154(-)